MLVKYYTVLECKSDPSFLLKTDPLEIIKSSSADLYSCQNGIYHYESLDVPIINEIHEFAKKHPNHEFIAKYWNVDAYQSEMRTIGFKDNSCFILRIEPHFYYDCPDYIKEVVGRDVIQGFFEKFEQYFLALKDIFPTVREKEKVTSLAMKTKAVSIELENEEFRIKATRRSFSFIKIDVNSRKLKEDPGI